MCIAFASQSCDGVETVLLPVAESCDWGVDMQKRERDFVPLKYEINDASPRNLLATILMIAVMTILLGTLAYGMINGDKALIDKVFETARVLAIMVISYYFGTRAAKND